MIDCIGEERLGPSQVDMEEPVVFHNEDTVVLRFQNGDVQSIMRASDPNALVISYTRAMAAFILFHPQPKRIALIGLGGGSIAKWCYHRLASTDITVVEINPQVIALREEFSIPVDSDRFRVVCGDGASHVTSGLGLPQVLLIDGFDSDGQPSQLCSQIFYDDCYRTLAADGLLVVNLCGPDDPVVLDRIRRSFMNRVFIVIPEDGENKVVFAWKGCRRWIDDTKCDEMAHELFLDFVCTPFLSHR